jgi:hypothetical protein
VVVGGVWVVVGGVWVVVGDVWVSSPPWPDPRLGNFGSGV